MGGNEGIPALGQDALALPAPRDACIRRYPKGTWAVTMVSTQAESTTLGLNEKVGFADKGHTVHLGHIQPGGPRRSVRPRCYACAVPSFRSVFLKGSPVEDGEPGGLRRSVWLHYCACAVPSFRSMIWIS